jgi:DNA-binding transcriptional regulator YdaS (Cro superfamily)
MNLKDYFSEQKGNAKSLAGWIGISPSFLSQIASGERPANLDLCVAIEKATNGKVTCEEIMPSQAGHFAYLRSQIEKAA